MAFLGDIKKPYGFESSAGLALTPQRAFAGFAAASGAKVKAINTYYQQKLNKLKKEYDKLVSTINAGVTASVAATLKPHNKKIKEINQFYKKKIEDIKQMLQRGDHLMPADEWEKYKKELIKKAKEDWAKALTDEDSRWKSEKQGIKQSAASQLSSAKTQYQANKEALQKEWMAAIAELKGAAAPGAVKISIPQLVGYTVSNAQSILSSLGLTYEFVTSPTSGNDLISSQSPSPGTLATTGDTVYLTPSISSVVPGTEPYSPPTYYPPSEGGGGGGEIPISPGTETEMPAELSSIAEAGIAGIPMWLWAGMAIGGFFLFKGNKGKGRSRRR